MVVLGIDVSKLKLDAALWLPEGRKWYALRADNNVAGVQKLLHWAQAKSGAPINACRIVLEATGIYHELAAEAAFEAGAEVVLANPKRVRDFASGHGILNKTDAVDARALARYGAEAEVIPWQPPPLEIRVLRALVARLAAVEEDLQRENNRREKARATATPALVLESLERTIQALQDERKRLQQAIDDHYDQHPGLKQQRDLLQTIPAVGDKSANQLLCLLRSKHFDSARQAAACSGLIPVHHRSGTSVHQPPRLSKQGDPRLRKVLYMASVSALRHNPQLRRIYDHFVQSGKAKMAALGVLMRKLVHIPYGIIKTGQPYNPALVSHRA
ncbi:IS110 family transposase [Nevskia soli]|uniref:IS110 family transposase n=1 Tax=Nevskia soli TaxID=418856 RepID=UPI0004A6BDA2|nr:IS110 family transposase [Nevskia soli]